MRPLSPRLARALEQLRALARAGVVEGPAPAVARSLGYRWPRSLQDVAGQLEEAGALRREHRAGSRGVRLAARAALTDLSDGESGTNGAGPF